MPGPGPDRGRDDPDRESTTPYQGVPRPTRRTLLDGVAALGGLALTSALVDQVRLGAIDASAPPADTWPLGEYDPGATASNRDATPPTDPVIDWVDESLAASRTLPVRVVVGPETVYASGVGVVALDRADGTRRWQADTPGGALALHDGTLAVATGARGTLRGFGTDGTEQWTSDLPDDVSSLVAADGTLFAGGNTGVYAFDAASGSRRWTDGDDWAEHVLVAAGRLTTVSDGGVSRYRRRSVLDVPLGSPPGRRWETATDVTTAAATGAALALGRATRRDGGPALLAVDDTGTARWRAFGNSGSDVIGATRLALTDYTCVATLALDGERPESALANVALADGTRRWRRPLDQSVSDLAVVGDAVLVATRARDDATDRSGSVRAFALADGTERWRVPVAPDPRSLAPVDGTVFVVTTDERVLAIR